MSEKSSFNQVVEAWQTTKSDITLTYYGHTWKVFHANQGRILVHSQTAGFQILYPYHFGIRFIHVQIR